jgi:hypothetical protein
VRVGKCVDNKGSGGLGSRWLFRSFKQDYLRITNIKGYWPSEMLEDRMQLYKRLRWEYEPSGGAQKYKVHRRTVRAALQNALPPKRKVTPRERPKMALAIPFIDAVLENNLKATFSNQLTAHQIWVRMQVEMPGCDIGESTVRAYVRVLKAELDEQQTSSQAAAAWMMEVLHRDVPLRFIEKEFPSGAASSLAGIIKGGDGGNERKR